MRSSNLKTYTGPIKPKDLVAYLARTSSEMVIAEIDGITVKQLKAQTSHDTNFSYIELLPGKHVVLVRGSAFHTSRRGFHPNLTIDLSSVTYAMAGETELTFEVEAGHVYVIKYKMSRSKKTNEDNQSKQILSVFVKDTLTGNIITRVDTEVKNRRR